jgi:hypothetical protein
MENAMTFIPFANCAEIVLDGLYYTKPIANVLLAQFPGTYVQGDLDALAAAVDNWMSTDYLPVCNTSVQYIQTRVRGLTNIIDLQATSNTSAGFGGASGTVMPGNVTLCFSLRTGFTGRSARGRFYAWPPSQNALSTGQVFGATYGTAMLTALSNLKAAIQSAGWAWGVGSRQTGGSPRTSGLFTPISVAIYTNLDADSQRGRLLSGH